MHAGIGAHGAQFGRMADEYSTSRQEPINRLDDYLEVRLARECATVGTLIAV